MNLDDERVRFYLRHRDQIEEWAALRDVAAEAIDDWLLAFRPAVVELAAALGKEVTAHVIDAGSPWPAYRLVKQAWPTEGPSIALEWSRAKTTLRASSSPYVGLRCPRDHALGGPLRESDGARKARARRRDVTSPWWVAYGYVVPAAPFPEEADAYHDQLLGALRSAWEDYAPLVDRVAMP